ncbi:MAG: hypothetical protein K9K75_05665 [Deltaproteobacteria bacterium]|nr:hypothetical protein [Deltaproteobacteria bacterium]
MSQEALLKAIKTKYEAKMLQEEHDSLMHWRAQLDKILKSKPEGIASILIQVKNVSEMMGNRMQILKKELREKDS